MVVLSAWNVGGTHCSGIVSSAADMIWMSVGHVMRGVVGVGVSVLLCAAWLERGRVDERIGVGLYQSCGNRECCTCDCVWVAVVWVV